MPEGGIGSSIIKRLEKEQKKTERSVRQKAVRSTYKTNKKFRHEARQRINKENKRAHPKKGTEEKRRRRQQAKGTGAEVREGGQAEQVREKAGGSREVVRVSAKSHLLLLDANSGGQIMFCDESETRRQPAKRFCSRANRGLRIRISWARLDHNFDTFGAEP